MQAIILAAGMGRRLGKFTRDNTKCMLSINGVRLIDRMLEQLCQLNLSRLIMVVGYKGEELIDIPLGYCVSNTSKFARISSFIRRVGK